MPHSKRRLAPVHRKSTKRTHFCVQPDQRKTIYTFDANLIASNVDRTAAWVPDISRKNSPPNPRGYLFSATYVFSSIPTNPGNPSPPSRAPIADCNKRSFRTFRLHVWRAACVKAHVRLHRLLTGLLAVSLAVSAFAGDSALDALLKGVETRYNKTKTLQVLFHEDYTPPGRAKRSESGTLALRKPLKMRWDYDQPKGKLFIGDGKYLWLFTPDGNRVERMKLKESDDMRAPLAFLLGKLDFQKEFRNLQAKAEGTDMRITAEPKTDNLPYSAVEFLVAPDLRIKVVRVTGFDRSITEFHFDQEKVDPPLDAKLFQFQAPKGTQIVETGQ
jgi:outer membrane lipoprotein carrier protein